LAALTLAGAVGRA